MQPVVGIEIGLHNDPVYPFTVSTVHGDVKNGRRIFSTEWGTKERAEHGQGILMDRFGVPGWSTPAAASVGRSEEFKALVAETTWPRPLAEHEAEFDAAHSG